MKTLGKIADRLVGKLVPADSAKADWTIPCGPEGSGCYQACYTGSDGAIHCKMCTC